MAIVQQLEGCSRFLIVKQVAGILGFHPEGPVAIRPCVFAGWLRKRDM
jgi:hypothetical protein